MNSPHSAEHEFTTELTQQTAHYLQTLKVAERIRDAIGADQDITHDLLELGQLMGVVGEFQQRAAKAEGQWRATKQQAGKPLEEAFAAHQSTLRQLLETVRNSEDMAMEAKSKLEPQMNAVARDRKVVQRYGDAARL